MNGERENYEKAVGDLMHTFETKRKLKSQFLSLFQHESCLEK